MSKQTFRKNINSRTTKMKAFLAAGEGAQTSVVLLSSSQPVRADKPGVQINFSKYDEISIFPRDILLKIIMLKSYQKVTTISISELIGAVAIPIKTFDFSFDVSNPSKNLMGDGNPYYRYSLGAGGVKKVIEALDSGYIDMYKDYTPEYLDEFWTRRDGDTEYATLLPSAYTLSGDTVIFKKSFS
jgi:hypothetical protein